MNSTAVPLLGDAAHRGEQPGDLGAGERGGGLVEHEQRELRVAARAVEGAGDADGGALGLGQLADRAVRVDLVAEPGRARPSPRCARHCG